MPFLARMPADARARMLELGEVEEIGAGALLMRRGELGGDIFLLRSGRLEVVDPRSSPPVVLDIIEAGELVGELGFVDAAPRSATVRARSACRCIVWRRDRLLRALAAEPVLAARFWQALTEAAADRVRRLSDTVRLGQSAPVAGKRPPEARELAEELREGLSRAEGDDQPEQVLGEVLARICGTLSRVGDADTGEVIADALHAEVGSLLARARTVAILAAAEGAGPPPPDVVRHLRQPEPQGDGPVGIALDAALRQLPSLAGVAAPVPEGAGGGLILGLATPEWGPQATLALALGELPGRLSGLPAVLLDGVAEGLPDRLLLRLLARLRSELAPGAGVLLAATAPAGDAGFVDHVLGWPMVRRPAEGLAELCGASGLVDVRVTAGPGARVDLLARVPRGGR